VVHFFLTISEVIMAAVGQAMLQSAMIADAAAANTILTKAQIAAEINKKANEAAAQAI
jgi:hypothetical protein